jgi:hypothetical protein
VGNSNRWKKEDIAEAIEKLKTPPSREGKQTNDMVSAK